MVYDKALLEQIKTEFSPTPAVVSFSGMLPQIFSGFKIIDCTKYMETSPPIAPTGTGAWHERYWYLIKAAFCRAWQEMKRDVKEIFSDE